MNHKDEELTLEMLTQIFTTNIAKMKSRVDKRLAKQIYNKLVSTYFDKDGNLIKESE